MKKRTFIIGLILIICFMFLFISLTSFSFVSASDSGEASQDFNLGGWWCDNGDWRNGGSKVSNNCSKYASSNNDESCCSDYAQCNPDGRCSGWVKYCYQFNNSDSCNWGTPKIAYMNQVNYTCGTMSTPDANGCVKAYQCRCKWNSTSTSTMKCMDVLNIVDAPTTNPTASCKGNGTCTWSTEIIENNCNNSLNYVKVTKKAVWAGTGTKPEGCKDMERQDTCPVTIKLPFFGSFMIFVSICFIIVIYFFMEIKKN